MAQDLIGADPSDQHLLALFVVQHDRDALEQLIRRHIQFVYACAMRQTHGDVHLAADVTQAVFILLVSKARTLRRDALLRGWLFNATRFSAANAIKMQNRRRYHERSAANLRAEASSNEGAAAARDRWQPLLDEAIASLSPRDRAGVLLSFFDNKTHRQIGATLGISEEAARKRVARAVRKMRDFLASRGMGEDVISLAASSAVAIPSGLVESAAASAWSATTVFAATSAAPSAAAIIANRAARTFALAKLKTATAIAAAIVFAASAGWGALLLRSAFAAAPSTTARATTAPAAPASAPAGAVEPDTTASAKFDDGVEVQLLGLASGEQDDPDVWWNADGSSAPKPCDARQGPDDRNGNYFLCFRLVGAPDDAGVLWPPIGSAATSRAQWKGQSIPKTTLMDVKIIDPKAKSVDLLCSIAAGKWEEIVSLEPTRFTTAINHARGQFGIAPPARTPAGTGTAITVTHTCVNYQLRIVVTDLNGQQHVADQDASSISNEKFTQMTAAVNVPPDEIRTIAVDVRPYDHIAEFKNVTLDPNLRTKPQVTATIRR